MKTRSILPVAVLGLFLVALFASACSHRGFDADQFGGTYTFGETRSGADKIKFEEKKKLEFETYMISELSLSSGTKLSRSLFEESIGANRSPNLAFADKMKRQQYDHVVNKQQYNYVIDVQGEIIVAIWDAGVDGVDLGNVLGGAACTETDFTPQDPQTMVNWFPEDSETHLSPCWLNFVRKDGLLDAISKHLMLAQPKGNTIDKLFSGESLWEEWTADSVKVAYAGEITVDLVSCTYSLNNNSGTYAPKGDRLAEVAKHFANEIKVGPISYVDFVFEDGELTSIVEHQTENLSTRISNAPPLCP